MHVTDTLAAGGAERMAVNLANLLPRDRYRVYFCNTRRDGPLSASLAPDVGRLALARRHRFDALAVRRLVRFVRAEDIRLLHVHGASLFIGALASALPPRPVLVWHAHSGRYALGPARRLHRLAAQRVAGIFAVTEALAEWAARSLRVPAGRVWYLPNFSLEDGRCRVPPSLPGDAGARIVCLANLRPEKDQLTLVRAIGQLAADGSPAHLLLVGSCADAAYGQVVRDEVARLGLGARVTFLGHRDDVPAVLGGCDIGVLSSVSEGFPLALLEYGAASLPVVATRVGQCAEILDRGRAGVLVPPGSAAELAAAIASMLAGPALRREYGAELRERVRRSYDADTVLPRVCDAYDRVLS
jgi:glycosyltransferase involved in cell wall biosynthesis